MTTPTTSAECRAEQERVLKLLSNADTPESWYYQPGWGLQKHNADGLGLIAGQSDFATHGDLLLLEAAPTLAQSHIALLGAYAEALEREARIMGHFQAAHDALRRRADESRIDFNIAARVVEAHLEAAKRSISPRPRRGPQMSGRQVLTEWLTEWRHRAEECEAVQSADPLVAAALRERAATLRHVCEMLTPLTQPTPTIPDNALFGMASIPDTPEPEQEALESLEYWLKTGTASNSDRCAMEQAARTVAAAYRAALHKVPQAPAEEAKP